MLIKVVYLSLWNNEFVVLTHTYAKEEWDKIYEKYKKTYFGRWKFEDLQMHI